MVHEIQDWSAMKDEYLGRLPELTGHDVAYWNKQIKKQKFTSYSQLNPWLESQGITGYPAMFLGYETFGYPDYMTKDGAALIDEQYADRPDLRPVFEAILQRVLAMGEMTVLARKGFVALLTEKRTFARIKPTTKKRIDVGLRLETQLPVGILKPSRVEPKMKVQVEASGMNDLTDEFYRWIRQAYVENLK